MGYSKKDNLDLNHYPASQDLRKQRTLMLALTPLWLVLTMNNMTDPDRSDLSRIIFEAMWALFVIVMMLNLTGIMNRWWKKSHPENYYELEDELAQHHRGISFQWGMMATVLVALFLFFIAPYTSLEAREAVQILILTALTVTAFRFILLEKDDGEEEPA
ncbi:hypothetical protein [Sphingomicrobium aestuariivivum]|uniref:hypothetical protein n=1 Tax=Sphingomicrobium aestuariivivum TaxID=1582356 RepID=UPI001FD7045D|nr:hypothetical protein [Sphingomicrobium aestuariivivum]MCJ8191464.1 hypothetical protein [Sphingomicrobium aestuariivivum]